MKRFIIDLNLAEGIEIRLRRALRIYDNAIEQRKDYLMALVRLEWIEGFCEALALSGELKLDKYQIIKEWIHEERRGD